MTRRTSLRMIDGTAMSKPERKAVQEYEQRLAAVDDTILACRRLKHAWDDNDQFVPYPVKDSRIMHLRLTMQCLRGCGVQVHEIYTFHKNRLERVARYTDYSAAHGYLVPGVPRGVSALTILQQEHYRRAMERAAGADPGERETGDR